MAESTAREATRTVFLSYAHADQETARAIRDELSRRGQRVWMDADSVSPGERWASSLHRAVENADAIAVLVSKQSLASSQVQLEVAAGVAGAERSATKRVLPVLIDPDVRPSGLLAAYQWLRPESFEPGVIAKAVADAVDRIEPIDKAHERAVARGELERLDEALARAEVASRRVETEMTGRVARVWLVVATVATVSAAIVVTLVSDSGGAAASSIFTVATALLGLGSGYYLGSRRSGR